VACHDQGVRALAAVSVAGGVLLASGGGDGTVRLWGVATDPTDGDAQATLTAVGEPLSGHDGQVSALAAMPLSDGQEMLVSGCDDGTVRLWDSVHMTAVGEPFLRNLDVPVGRYRTLALQNPSWTERQGGCCLRASCFSIAGPA
jgi:WD40 repeat protein